MQQNSCWQLTSLSRYLKCTLFLFYVSLWKGQMKTKQSRNLSITIECLILILLRWYKSKRESWEGQKMKTQWQTNLNLNDLKKTLSSKKFGIHHFFCIDSISNLISMVYKKKFQSTIRTAFFYRISSYIEIKKFFHIEKAKFCVLIFDVWT